MLHSSFLLLWIPPELWKPPGPQCPDLQKHLRAADTRNPQRSKKTPPNAVTHPFFTLLQTWYTSSVLSPPINFWYPQGPCLPWLRGNAWEPRSCNKTWLTGSPAALSTMRTFRRSLSSPVYYKGTGVGAYPTMHCAKRKHSGLVAIHHWERLETLHRTDRAEEVETSCCVSTVLTTESPCRLTRTTYQCRRVKTDQFEWFSFLHFSLSIFF